MTINKTILPCYNEISDKTYDEVGYIINLMLKDFPITITGTEDKKDLKKYVLQTVNLLFDKAWDDYESAKDNKYVYQFGMLS